MRNKTLLITGASSGIGKATVELFSRRGWNVAATMRNPDHGAAIRDLPGVQVFMLDVADAESVSKAVSAVIDTFGGIDVLVNNAGYAAIGPFEAATEEQIRRQFDTNLFGLMDVTRAVLPHFRERRSGRIINISSAGGRTTFPLFSLYNSTKWAVEGFSEALRYELKQFNIKVKIIEPGAIKTDFYTRSLVLLEKDELSVYHDYAKKVITKLVYAGMRGVTPVVVARKIYRAATNPFSRMRYPAGGGAGTMLILRKILPSRFYNAIIAAIMESNYTPKIKE
jgi:NAD(P)-dependent dehydrogenase (short-subunit alcohol dehydrogenase family)